MTYSSPSRTIVVSKLTGSEEATPGSVMANDEPNSPSSNGFSHFWVCCCVAKSCNNSILGTSGAWQLKTRDAHSSLPKTSATPANSRLLNLVPGSFSVSRGSAIFHRPSSRASTRSVRSMSGVLWPECACSNQSLLLGKTRALKNPSTSSLTSIALAGNSNIV